MRLRPLISLPVCAALVLATGGPTVVAQGYDTLRYPFLDGGQRQAAPRTPVSRPREPSSYSRPREPSWAPSPEPAYQPHYTAPAISSTPSTPPARRQPVATAARDAIVKPKADPATFVLVIGDSLGELLAQGLDQVLADVPDVAILHKAKGDSGLVRSDFYDWPRAAKDLLAEPRRIAVGIILIGSNDRQSLRDAGEVLDPGSERWNQVYGARIDDIARSFAEKKVPLIWVGLPPMKNERLSTEAVTLNAAYRERVQKAGGIFVDTWEAFVDAENRYSAYGPDMAGDTTKLRTNDGVHFTKAGAFKLAHFVGLEMKRFIDTKPAPIVATPALPGDLDPALRPGDVERVIDQAMTALPEPPGAIAIPQKPPAGPVIALTRPDSSTGATLAGDRSASNGEAAALIERVFGEGRSPDPRPGRADDFHWPKTGS